MGARIFRAQTRFLMFCNKYCVQGSGYGRRRKVRQLLRRIFTVAPLSATICLCWTACYPLVLEWIPLLCGAFGPTQRHPAFGQVFIFWRTQYHMYSPTIMPSSTVSANQETFAKLFFVHLHIYLCTSHAHTHTPSKGFREFPKLQLFGTPRSCGFAGTTSELINFWKGDIRLRVCILFITEPFGRSTQARPCMARKHQSQQIHTQLCARRKRARVPKQVKGHFFGGPGRTSHHCRL